MINWLYRCILRGWTVLLVGGIITSLWLGWQAIRSQTPNSAEHTVTAPRSAAPPAARGR
jgi:threonine/homoserine/homoserine lactone efflux protein